MALATRRAGAVPSSTSYNQFGGGRVGEPAQTPLADESRNARAAILARIEGRVWSCRKSAMACAAHQPDSSAV